MFWNVSLFVISAFPRPFFIIEVTVLSIIGAFYHPKYISIRSTAKLDFGRVRGNEQNIIL